MVCQAFQYVPAADLLQVDVLRIAGAVVVAAHDDGAAVAHFEGLQTVAGVEDGRALRPMNDGVQLGLGLGVQEQECAAVE